MFSLPDPACLPDPESEEYTEFELAWRRGVAALFESMLATDSVSFKINRLLNQYILEYDLSLFLSIYASFISYKYTFIIKVVFLTYITVRLMYFHANICLLNGITIDIETT